MSLADAVSGEDPFTVGALLGVGFGSLLRMTASLEMPGVVALVAEELVATSANWCAFAIIVITGGLPSKMFLQLRSICERF